MPSTVRGGSVTRRPSVAQTLAHTVFYQCGPYTKVRPPCIVGIGEEPASQDGRSVKFKVMLMTSNFWRSHSCRRSCSFTFSPLCQSGHSDHGASPRACGSIVPSLGT
eukprot:jgi/Botrbrau1/15991/Bobra.0241s0002.1